MSTATPDKTIRTPNSISKLLDELRSRIRRYVVIEGIAMTIIWLVVAFWLMLAMDYLPVLLGANEMPRGARMVLLGLTVLGVLLVAYWYIFRRVFCTFRNSSLAILIERQFPSFRDSLVTTVELGGDLDDVEQQDHEAIQNALPNSQAMLWETVENAESSVEDVELSRVFNYKPLAGKITGAVVAVLSLVLLGIFGGNVLGIGASRLLGLSSNPWPRRAAIEMVGFTDDQRKIAKGTDFIVRVRADANRAYPPPELCSILYKTDDGDSGRVNMSRDGEPRGGFQYYVFNGKPFKGVLNDIQFDVIGYDHRLRDQTLKVVLSPVVTAIQLDSKLPPYIGDVPRQEKWTPGLQLPIGSQVQATIETSKPLTSASIRDIDSGQEASFDFSSEPKTSWNLDLGSLAGRKAISITLNDTDGIASLEPHLLTIGAVEDTIPNVDISLRGIGTAITAQARLPIEGTINDDYEVNRSWFGIKIGDESREFEFPLPVDGPIETALDLREESTAAREKPIVLKPQDRVIFTVKASDKFDLEGGTHTGSSDPTVLTVVRSDELLAILDGRELGLRRRFEQIRSEMMQSRDSLARLRASFREDTETESADEEVDVKAAQKNLADLRDRWASWAGQKGEQSSMEVEGIALAFEDIREELVNNRVDTQERKSRMDGQIIGPLRQISGELFPTWQDSLTELRTMLREEDTRSESKSVAVVGSADQIIVAMDAILEKMLELEDYAELVKIVRQIIEQQEGLLEQTKDEQKSSVLNFLDP